MEEIIEKSVKKVDVLIDLLGYGIVELSVAYSLKFTGLSPRAYDIDCHIDQLDPGLHGWLYSPDFKLVFSEIETEIGHVVCFSGAGLNKNVYYQTMLNVVSDYIFLKEKLFR
ncbi:hypothetical protein [Pedobacter miscanthi]|jgi:hypothetical protein|uniref:hypothetical protein n=1 Tax=Pedobacter miscanthi TaxID=2259170 RepID=UPI00292EEA8C|nr:hypothetical protein [Pedobacter miscanthi]